MRSLDDILCSQTREQYEERLTEALNTDTWTKGNRDDKLSTTLDIFAEVSQNAEEFVRRMLESSNGPSVISLTVQRELLVGLVQMYRVLREQLDLADEATTPQLPFDHEWLNYQIKCTLSEITKLSDQIEDKAAPLPVEEL